MYCGSVRDEHAASIAVKPASGGDWREIVTLPVQGNGATGSELTALGSLGTLNWSPDEFDSHQIFTATDGEAGYRSICENAPDLVILDLMLPKLNGYDLCKRPCGEGFRAPIMMLSARSVESDRVMGLDLGPNDYVTKPFSLRELRRAYGRCCAANRAR